MSSSKNEINPPQSQDRQPGIESEMTPRPDAEDHGQRGSGKLEGKVRAVTLVTLVQPSRWR